MTRKLLLGLAVILFVSGVVYAMAGYVTGKSKRAPCSASIKGISSSGNSESYEPYYSDDNRGRDLKPVIYLYPLKEQEVSVRLEYAGDITVSYPKYDPLFKGWKVKAYPDGKLIDLSDQQEYSYIFWEGNNPGAAYDLSEGFIVEGVVADVFLRETLSKMGLTPREYNEFIVYWYPKLKQNKYNLIHFAYDEYEKTAMLSITPQPDSILRVFMVYKPVPEKVDIKPQEIKPFVRAGFAVIEWGGTGLEG